MNWILPPIGDNRNEHYSKHILITLQTTLLDAHSFLYKKKILTLGGVLVCLCGVLQRGGEMVFCGDDDVDGE